MFFSTPQKLHQLLLSIAQTTLCLSLSPPPPPTRWPGSCLCIVLCSSQTLNCFPNCRLWHETNPAYYNQNSICNENKESSTENVREQHIKLQFVTFLLLLLQLHTKCVSGGKGHNKMRFLWYSQTKMLSTGIVTICFSALRLHWGSRAVFLVTDNRCSCLLYRSHSTWALQEGSFKPGCATPLQVSHL